MASNTDNNIFDGDEKNWFVPVIKVIGVGGGGNNAVNGMFISDECGGVEYLNANTDLQALSASPVQAQIQLGKEKTLGLGAGALPHVGREAAEESCDVIADYLRGAHVVFVAAGMGGGTGTGAAPVIARIARDLGAMTIAVVTTPFLFEGEARAKAAEAGILELERHAHTVMVVSNQSLFRVVGPKTSFTDAFAEVDAILKNSVKSMSDLLWKPGLVNLDLADMKSILSSGGMAMIGSGEASGDDRARKSFLTAIANPLLEGIDLSKATGMMVGIFGGTDMTLLEVDEIVSSAKELFYGGAEDHNKNFIFGTTIDEAMNGIIGVCIVATGATKHSASTGISGAVVNTSTGLGDSISTQTKQSSMASASSLDIDVVDLAISDADSILEQVNESLFSSNDGYVVEENAEVPLGIEKVSENVDQRNQSQPSGSRLNFNFTDADSFFDEVHISVPPQFMSSDVLELMMKEMKPRLESSFAEKSSERSGLYGAGGAHKEQLGMFTSTTKGDTQKVHRYDSNPQTQKLSVEDIQIPTDSELVDEDKLDAVDAGLLRIDDFEEEAKQKAREEFLEEKVQDGSFWGSLKKALQVRKQKYDLQNRVSYPTDESDEGDDFKKKN